MKNAGRIVAKVAKVGGITVAVSIAGLVVAVVRGERKVYDAPYPAIVASRDPAVIARGRYLAYGPAHCSVCHGAVGAAPGTGDIAFTGGMEMKLPVGIFRPANITSDIETGIGGLSDGQIARSLRHGVRRDGKAMLPFMPFANLSDEDLTAVISFLRAQPPVRHKVETRSPNLLGRVVAALLIKPEGPKGVVPAAVPAAATAAYGSYITHSVANCVGCHTKRDLRTGAYVGPEFAGGLTFPSEKDPQITFVTPNLTFARTGRITNWTEEIFIARVRTGKGAEGSPMPWSAFARMSDQDLRAVYAYLKSLPPVENDTGASVRPEVVAQESSAGSAPRNTATP
jgi:mono/diheme cytochrome c family protein